MHLRLEVWDQVYKGPYQNSEFRAQDLEVRAGSIIFCHSTFFDLC